MPRSYDRAVILYSNPDNRAYPSEWRGGPLLHRQSPASLRRPAHSVTAEKSQIPPRPRASATFAGRIPRGPLQTHAANRDISISGRLMLKYVLWSVMTP